MKIIYWIGIDDHADKWTIAQYRGDEERPSKVFELVPDEKGYRRLLSHLKGLDGEVRIVYEAGPCDRESLRDLIRSRESTMKDVGRMRKQILHLLLRYGHRYREGQAWTLRFWSWLKKIELAGAHSRFVLDEMISELEHRISKLERYDERIELAAQKPEYQPYLAALRTLRGINTLSAMTVLSELGDLRRFGTAPQLMSAVGVVPSEYSTGDKTNRFAITKTGNAHVRRIMVEAAWQYQLRPTLGRTIKARRKDQPKEIVEIAEKCEKRLSSKFYRLTSRNKKSTVAVVAVARELLGFVWAIGQIAHP
jgi:transposase